VMVMKPVADAKNLSLFTHIPDNFQKVVSDRDKCRHILQNLVSNAVKFTNTGSVEIAAAIDKQGIAIHVKDTGIGIDEKQIAIIFDEFRQADENTSRQYGGSGLGLAIAKKYAEILKGNIQVESVPKQGSTFTLHLPINEKAVESFKSNAISSEVFDTKIVSKELAPTILIVEDSEPQVIQLTDILSSEGYKIKVASNGFDALKLISESQPDAIILDLMMPEMDGFEVLQSIRKNFETIIPILILTAKHLTNEDLSVLKGNHINQLVQKGELNRVDLVKKLNLMIADINIPPKTHLSKKPFKKAGDPTILLIEDNPDNSMTIKALLGDKYFLLTAENGISGLEKALHFEPTLILLDITLPGMDGFEVLKGIRETESIKSTPIIAVTARAMKGDKEMLLEFGFDAYVPKPIDPELLEKTIIQLLHGN
ncbi:MAG: response regulator, partial [Ignavibacteria bacterium]|nr:response regulator [Ignavibacteria bacterium]